MPPQHPDRNEAATWATWLGFALLLVLFYALNTGITCTNDGSHLALMRSLADRGTSVLGPDLVFARHDAAVYQGQYYSDRHPGLGFIGFVFLKTAGPLADALAPLRLDPWSRPHLAGAERTVALLMLLPPLCGALVFVALAGVLRRFGAGPWTALAISSVMATSTLMLRYSTLLYSHVFAALAVVCGFLLLLDHAARGSDARLFGAIAALSCAVVIEHATVLLLIPTGGFLLSLHRGGLFTPRRLVGVGVAGLAPLVPLLVYNAVNFGGPFTISQFHHATVSQHHEVASIFSIAGLPRQAYLLLLSGAPFVSLLGASPHLGIALFSAPLFATGRVAWDRRHALALGMALMAFLPAALYAVEVGGYDRDYRQMLYGMPFLAVFVGVPLVWLERRTEPWIRRGARPAVWVGFLGLALRSFGIQLDHVRHAGQAEMGALVPNLAPALFNTAPVIVAAGIATAAWIVLQRRRDPPPAADAGRVA